MCIEMLWKHKDVPKKKGRKMLLMGEYPELYVTCLSEDYRGTRLEEMSQRASIWEREAFFASLGGHKSSKNHKRCRDLGMRM